MFSCIKKSNKIKEMALTQSCWEVRCNQVTLIWTVSRHERGPYSCHEVTEDGCILQKWGAGNGEEYVLPLPWLRDVRLGNAIRRHLTLCGELAQFGKQSPVFCGRKWEEEAMAWLRHRLGSC